MIATCWGCRDSAFTNGDQRFAPPSTIRTRICLGSARRGFMGSASTLLTAVLLLAIGLSIAIKKAPPQANRLDRIILCGSVFIALPMAVFGTEHCLDPTAVGNQKVNRLRTKANGT
jgi:hypothetical protein